MGKEIQLYTDASYRTKTGDGSIAYVVIIDDKISHVFSETTFGVLVNCLEFTAIKKGLENIIKNYLPDLLDVTHIDIFTDSNNCVKYITNEWIVSNENLIKIKEDYDELVDNLYRSYSVTLNIHHVAGHGDCKLNKIADKICTIISEYNRDKTLEE